MRAPARLHTGWGRPHCAPSAAGASPWDRSSSHKETPPQRLRNRCPSTPPHRALPRPCSCPPAPSMPSPTSSLLPLPFPKTKERSTPSPALPSPHRAPGLAVFPTRQYHKICPVLHPPPVSTHLSNNLEGTDLTSHFSFPFPPPPSPLPHFLFLTREEIKDVTKHFPKCPLTPFKANSKGSSLPPQLSPNFKHGNRTNSLPVGGQLTCFYLSKENFSFRFPGTHSLPFPNPQNCLRPSRFLFYH